MNLILLWLLLGVQSETCHSTIFGYDGDKWSGGYDAKDSIRGVAHRSIRRGRSVIVVLGSNAVSATVVDSGPYGRTSREGKWYNGAGEYRACNEQGVYPLQRQCYRPGSRWRGCLDLTPATAKALGHDGWDIVTVYWYGRPRVRRRGGDS